MKRLKTITGLLTGLIATMPVVSAELMSLTYDANGNLITGDGKFRNYNDFNQLVEVYNGSDSSGNLLERYEWDPVQERILIKDVFEAGSIKETVYYINDNFYQIENVSGIFNFTKIMHDGVLVAENTPAGKRFYSADPLGSSSLTTDAGGVPIENTTMDAFGNILSGGSGRFDYEDREYSSLTGDYDFHFRKFNPTLKIFTQPDTLISNVYDPQQLNRYMFERGNPYARNDPDGHVAPLIIAGAAAYAILAWGDVVVNSAIAASYASMALYHWNDPKYEYYKKKVFAYGEDAAASLAPTPSLVGIPDAAGEWWGDFKTEYNSYYSPKNGVSTGLNRPGLPASSSAITMPPATQISPQSNLAVGSVRGMVPLTPAGRGLQDQINAQFAHLGIKNVATVDSKTGKIGYDQGKLTRARILQKAYERNNRTAKNRK